MPENKSPLVPFTAICYTVLFLASLTAAGFAFAEYDEGHSSPAYRNAATERWGMVGEVVGSMFVLSSAIGVLFLIFRSRTMWIASLLATLVSLACIPVWINAGLGEIKDAKQRGGDWAGMSIMSGMTFGVGIPVILGLLALAGTICVFRLRPVPPTHQV